MNDTTLGAANVPWHLWLIGGLSLLFNAMGVISYTMTKFDMLAEAGMTADQIAFMNAYPVWASAFWALGVWGAFAGSVLLLLRSRFAVPAMVVATIGLVGTTVYNYGLIEVPAAMEAPALDIAIWAVTLSLLLYVRRMEAARVLK